MIKNKISNFEVTSGPSLKVGQMMVLDKDEYTQYMSDFEQHVGLESARETNNSTKEFKGMPKWLRVGGYVLAGAGAGALLGLASCDQCNPTPLPTNQVPVVSAFMMILGM